MVRDFKIPTFQLVADNLQNQWKCGNGPGKKNSQSGEYKGYFGGHTITTVWITKP